MGTFAHLSGRLTASLLLALCAPALLVLIWRGARVVRSRRTGRNGRSYDQFALDRGAGPGWGLVARFGAAHWPALANVVRGEMALVGPRPRPVGELHPGNVRHARVLELAPGLVGSSWVRRRRGIDYGPELEADLEDVRRAGPRHDLGVLVRAAAAALTGDAGHSSARECRVLGVRTDALSMDEAVERMAVMAGSDAPSQVCFANADCLNWACRDSEYRVTLGRARLVLPDGIGIRLASRIAGQSLSQNVNGTDLFPRLCVRLARERRRVYLLGGRPGVAQDVRRWVEERHPGAVIVGAEHGYFNPSEEAAVIEHIRASRADVLLVAFGAPRQDVWIRRHLPRLGVHLAIGVGGLFDFYSGSVPRAPQWVQELGMEWAFRLVQEPGRLWRRYLIGNVVFLSRVLLEASGLVRYGEAIPPPAPQGEAVA